MTLEKLEACPKCGNKFGQAEYDSQCCNAENCGYTRFNYYQALPDSCPETENGLRPCPFCGGKAYYIESVNGSNMAYVGCAVCGFDIKAAVFDGKLSKDIKFLWNTRWPAVSGTWASQRLADLIEIRNSDSDSDN
jgi:Restriction alleviation protein Lar